MIRAGDMIENPVTGERMLFHETSRDTNGERVTAELFVRPDGFVAAAHVHPFQTERFEVKEGLVGVKVSGEKLLLGPGSVTVVGPGESHTWWNAGDEEARFVVTVTPARQFEQLIETMFGLAFDGKTNKKGMPNPFRLAVIADHHFDDVRLPFLPAWMQKTALALGAPLGRALGYTHDYKPRATTEPAFA